MRKVTIIGAAGTLGSTCAMTIANSPDELCLIDINEKLLDNHVMDLENAFPGKYIYRGSYKDLTNSSIVIITAGVPNRNEETSRNAYLEDNIHIIQQIGKQIVTYAPEAIIISVSNPVDLLNYYLYKNFNFKRHQLIGYTLNDSYRFEWAINKVTNFYSDNRINTPVIGEHGESQVPVFSQVNKRGENISFTSEQQELIQEEIGTWFVRFNGLNIKRTTGWTTGIGISRIVYAIFNEEFSIITGSAVLDGEYDYNDVSIGVPLIVNRKGIQKVIQWDLHEGERNKFHDSVMKVNKIISDNSFLFK